jgi:peptidoglycan/LPS O-acetylase OafA/YrhL
MSMFGSSTNSNHNRYVALDGLREVAALSVMIHHLISFRGLKIFDKTSVAVDLFFILSGFVITHSYASAQPNRFLRCNATQMAPFDICGSAS